MVDIAAFPVDLHIKNCTIVCNEQKFSCSNSARQTTYNTFTCLFFYSSNTPNFFQLTLSKLSSMIWLQPQWKTCYDNFPKLPPEINKGLNFQISPNRLRVFAYQASSFCKASEYTKCQKSASMNDYSSISTVPTLTHKNNTALLQDRQQHFPGLCCSPAMFNYTEMQQLLTLYIGRLVGRSMSPFSIRCIYQFYVILSCITAVYQFL